jgi:hypothetical protein
MDEITPEWLTRALRIGGSLDSGSVKSLRIEPIGEGLGFVGEVARILADYSGDAGLAPKTLVAKIAIANDKVRHFAMRTGMYERETHIYKYLGDDFGVQIPGLYYGNSDPKSGYFILLLEDLSHLRAGDETKVGSVDDAVAAIRYAAQLHPPVVEQRPATPDSVDKRVAGSTIGSRQHGNPSDDIPDRVELSSGTTQERTTARDLRTKRTHWSCTKPTLEQRHANSANPESRRLPASEPVLQRQRSYRLRLAVRPPRTPPPSTSPTSSYGASPWTSAETMKHH